MKHIRVICLGFVLTGGFVATPLHAAVFDVKTFGAVGDGKTVDTAAINKAIDAAHAAGGGTVEFSPGTYLSFSIHLQSNIALYLKHGATILAAETPPEGGGDYDPPETNRWDKYQDFGHSHWHNSLIWGEDLENVSILGPGLIYGKGLSRGSSARNRAATNAPPSEAHRDGDRPEYPNPRDTLEAGIGNKSIALKNCHNVILRDFSILHGGHFAILATGVDNFTLDNLKIDTNRDGLDIDCCRNVRVSNCSVNSPWDDAICPKSSYALGYARPTENLTIVNCFVTGGYQEGTLLDGTYRRFTGMETNRIGHTGRIKCGTESNGGFKNITIANCVFDYCGGLALESVDGAIMEDVTIDNIAMRDIVNSPIFIRLGNRARGPDNPPVGVIRRVNISNIVCSNSSWRLGSVISGISNHPIEELHISNVHFVYQGGGVKTNATIDPPEGERLYPEPGMFGTMPAYGFFIRHVKGLEMDHVDVSYVKEEMRPPIVLNDVAGADFDHVKARRTPDVPFFILRNVSDFTLHNCPGVTDTNRTTVEHDSF
jgi:polygalacturonase